MNSVFNNSRTYSCALDCFMEVAAYLFLPHLSHLPIRHTFTALLFNTCSDYLNSRENSSLLKEIRDPIWSYLIEHCSSLVARDYNACFSQIFQEKTFGDLNAEEEKLIATLRTFESFCSTCQNYVTLKCYCDEIKSLFCFSVFTIFET